MFQLSNLVLKVTLHLMLLSISLKCANTARILNTFPPEPEAGIKNPPLLTFFMHDILGGSAPSERVVAGTIANTQINGLPFAKRNGGVFPIKGGIPLVTSNNGGINNKNIGPINNNLPFLTGLKGAPNTITSNNGKNNLVPFATAGQIPQGATLQQLMFGTITVIDDELTEGQELGYSVIGKAQGFYLASSLDGSSHVLAFTALFGDHEEDCISFFGVHRTAADESLIAVVGGTGKYANAEGFGCIKTVHLPDQHTTDGVETLLQFSVHLSPV